MAKSPLCSCPRRPSAPVRGWVRVPSRMPPSLLLITTNWPHSFFFSPLRYNGIIHLYNLMSRHSRHRARSSATSIEKTKAEANEGKRRRRWRISALKHGGSFSASFTFFFFFFVNIKTPEGKLGNTYMCHSCRRQQWPRANHSTQGEIPKAG